MSFGKCNVHVCRELCRERTTQHIQVTHNNESRHTSFIFVLLINVLLLHCLVLLFIFTHHSFEMQKENSRQTCTFNLPNDTYFLYKVGVHNYLYNICSSNYNISVQFVEKKA